MMMGDVNGPRWAESLNLYGNNSDKAVGLGLLAMADGLQAIARAIAEPGSPASPEPLDDISTARFPPERGRLHWHYCPTHMFIHIWGHMDACQFGQASLQHCGTHG